MSSNKVLFAKLQRQISAVYLGIFACLFLSVSANANENQFELFVQKAINLQIANDEKWIKLLHYEGNKSNPSGLQSAISSTEFFLSESGNIDPFSELRETIRGVFKEQGLDKDSHPQCRFPARYLWLDKVLNFDQLSIPKAKCEAYDKWAIGGNVDSISLLYATGYLGNPASYYGHTLLKFNSRHKLQSKLLDVSVNYGAIVPSDEDPISYIVKGMLGGYGGGFSHIEFYFHNHNYGELELRDVWEYELGFSNTEVQLMVAHLWELMGQKNTYYFFRKNCAYRIAEILELADGLKIIPEDHPWVFPQTIATKLNEHVQNESALVQGIKYHPSRQSRLYARYDQLNDQEKTVVATAVHNINILNTSEYNRLNSRSKLNVLQVLEDYFQFADGSKDSLSDTKKTRYAKVLAKHFELPVMPYSPSSYEAIAPHKGRSPGMLRIGYVSHQSQHEGALIVIRPSYYDVLDGGNGNVANSALTMFDTKLIYQDDGFYLRYLDVVSIESVNSGKTGLPKDTGLSWKIKLGAEQQSLKCDSCLVARFQGDIGYAKDIGMNNVVGTYIGTGLQNNRNGYGAMYGKSTWFANAKASKRLKVRAQAEYRYHLDSKEKNEDVYLLEARYELNKNWDLRFQFEKNKSEEYTLSVGYYW